jgi:hypothetical protein
VNDHDPGPTPATPIKAAIVFGLTLLSRHWIRVQTSTYCVPCRRGISLPASWLVECWWSAHARTRMHRRAVAARDEQG